MKQDDQKTINGGDLYKIRKKGKGPITRKNMNAYENRIVNTLEYDNPDYKLKKCDV